MKNNKLLISLLVAGIAALAIPAVASADTGADIFGSKCVSCHGKDGQGTPGLAPALKGDPFVVSGKLEDIEATIQNGRAGDQKKYKDIPVAMPPWHLSDADLKAVVAYIRGDLQKQ
ncbi:MAG TPA: c-type cytochrome [Gammaproteobacteria bacterium]|nr:c-type cytochrome [Gammaproteobacteria bacterium]